MIGITIAYGFVVGSLVFAGVIAIYSGHLWEAAAAFFTAYVAAQCGKRELDNHIKGG
jgi:hypothetical protein